MSGSAAREQATNEYALMSTAIQKRSRGVSTNRPFEILGGGERHRVDEDVEPTSEGVRHLREDPREIVVGADVALGDQGAVDGRREVAHVLLDAFALVRERDARALVGEPLRDRPGDRALVRDTEDERLLAFEPPGHRAILIG